MGACALKMAPLECMPPSEAPINVNEPKEPADNLQEAGGPAPESPGAEASEQGASPPFAIRGSRWVDYDTHELLEMISELEDERRWARLREGILWALLFHILLISAMTWIPKYVFKVPPVIDPIDAMKDRKYLDVPLDALKELQSHPVVKPVQPKHTTIDKKTLEAMNKPAPPPPTPAPEPAPTPTVQPPPTQPAPSTQPSPVEAPRPSAVPARPNFAMGTTNPNDQLRHAMEGASRPGVNGPDSAGGSGLARHPGAGGGGQILSDTQGVDFSAWLQRWRHETQNTWDPLIPDEVNAPINKQGIVVISFKVLPNGRLMDGSVKLEGRSGDSALDRAAWGALTGSNYPPLPRDFHGPFIEMRASFWYNVTPPN
jgi:outer membrane biosynthesis protein TonB